jgi:hypothetical protein
MEELKNKANEADCLRDLVHYIGRLGGHRHAVSIIVSAVMKVPSLRHISEVRLAPPSEVRNITLHPDSLDPYHIVKRICKKATEIDSSSRLHAIVESIMNAMCGAKWSAIIRSRLEFMQSSSSLISSAVNPSFLSIMISTYDASQEFCSSRQSQKGCTRVSWPKH